MGKEIDFSHYDEICDRLDRARGKFLAAVDANSRYYWEVQVTSAEKERADEVEFLGIKQPTLEEILSDELITGAA